MALSTTLRGRLIANLTSSLDLGLAPIAALDYSFNTSLASGTGSGQADMMWSDQRTITGSGTEDLDLSALTNAFGQAIAFTNIKVMVVKAAPANAGDITIGPRATEGFADFFGDASDRISLPPGGTFLITSPAAGEGIVNNADDKLTITNTVGTSVVYDVIIIGVATVS